MQFVVWLAVAAAVWLVVSVAVGVAFGAIFRSALPRTPARRRALPVSRGRP